MNLPEHTPATPDHLTAEMRELLLSRKVWTQAVSRLAGERAHLLHALKAAEPTVDSALRLRLLEVEHETAMYEICLDRVHEQVEHAEGSGSPETARRRDRFYRLMRGLAKAGNERANQGSHDPHMASMGGEDWSPTRWVSEMQAAATEARKQLIAVEAE